MEKVIDLPETERELTPKCSPDEESVCKICLDNCNETSPCQCKGTLQYVHEQCLLAWIGSRRNLVRKAGDIYEFQCEACKTPVSVTYRKRYRCVNGYKGKCEDVCTMLLILMALTVSVSFSVASIASSYYGTGLDVISLILLPFQLTLLVVFIKLWLIDPFIAQDRTSLKLIRPLT